MPSFPIASSQVNVPDDWQPIAITVTNTSATQPASVRITSPDGNEVWACSLGPKGVAIFGQGITTERLAAGVYTVTVTGNVVGRVDR
jgi:hypothetical protein